MEFFVFLIQIMVLLFSVVLHEVSHGLMAEKLGDPTARLYGRLTLNPFKHLDLWGSFLIPLFLFTLSGGRFLFGWAKPVPYNPYNLKNQKWGPGLVGAAGPLANLSIALIFGLAMRFMPMDNIFSFKAVEFFGYIAMINIVLMVFNLFPIPPLDGSKILYSFIPFSHYNIVEYLEHYSFIIFVLFILFGFDSIIFIAQVLFRLITGLPGF